jgi:hypothetical protein
MRPIAGGQGAAQGVREQLLGEAACELVEAAGEQRVESD